MTSTANSLPSRFTCESSYYEQPLGRPEVILRVYSPPGVPGTITVASSIGAGTATGAGSSGGGSPDPGVSVGGGGPLIGVPVGTAVELLPQATAAKSATIVTRNMIVLILVFIAVLRQIIALFSAFFLHDEFRRDFFPESDQPLRYTASNRF